MEIRNYQTLLRTTLITLFIGISINATAHNKIVVVPLSADAEPLENVITVSAKNGDFTTLQAAMSFLSSTGGGGLVLLGPGNYSLNSTVTIPNFVNLVGSGTRVTTIIATVSSTADINASAGFIISDFSSASNFTLINQGGASGDTAVGIIMDSNSMLSEVLISVSGSKTNAYGIYKKNVSSAQLFDSEIFIDNSGTNSTGILVDDGTLFVKNTDVYIGGSFPSSSSNIGAQDTVSGRLFLRHSTVDAIGTNSTGVIINNSASNIIQTQANGTTADITDNVGGTKNCIDVYDNELFFLGSC